MSIVLSHKDPLESVVLTLDYPDLATGETLTTILNTLITVLEGSPPDNSPFALLQSAPQIATSGTQVQIPVQAGISGVFYEFEVLCQTSNPNKKILGKAILPVR